MLSALAIATSGLVLPPAVTPGQAIVAPHRWRSTSPINQRVLLQQQESPIFPTTNVISGLFGGDDGYAKASASAIPGSAKDLDLGSMLDTVPLDPNGAKGMAKDEAGKERLKDRMEAVEERAEDKVEALLAIEQKS